MTIISGYCFWSIWKCLICRNRNFNPSGKPFVTVDFPVRRSCRIAPLFAPLQKKESL